MNRRRSGYGPDYFDRAGRRLLERCLAGPVALAVLVPLLLVLHWAGCARPR